MKPLPSTRIGVAVLFIAALLSGSVHGASDGQAGKRLVVTVFDRTTTGPRVAGAVVCLSGYPVKTTDGQGTATFENVAAGGRTLAVWKSGFQRATVPLLFNEFTSPQSSSTILLTPGTGTAPPCEVAYTAGTVRPVAADPPRITQFSIGRENPAYVGTEDNLVLYAPHTGSAPTHYRVSTSPTFAGADWRRYQPEVAGFVGIGRFFGASTGSKTLYFQYRAGETATAAVSNVMQDTVEVVTIVDHRITDVAALIAHAEANGFSFSLIESTTPAACPRLGLPSPFRGVLRTMFGGETGKVGDGRVAYSLFVGRNLNPAWGLRNIEMSITKSDDLMQPPPASSVDVTYRSGGNPRDARTTIRFTAKAKAEKIGGRGGDWSSVGICPVVEASIMRIVLSGPAGRDWREAFNRQ